jgi:hypothetical protein
MSERTSDATDDATTDTTVAPTPAASTETYRVRHTGSGSISTTLVAAISEHVGIDPMDFQLYSYLDPDSLDALFKPLRDAGDGKCGWVEFHVLGHRAVIYSTGEIEISTQEPTIPDST